jgi:hypothetical protein
MMFGTGGPSDAQRRVPLALHTRGYTLDIR